MHDTGTVSEVPFTTIPNQSRLYLSYLGRALEALSFYQRPPDLGSLVDLARGELAGASFPRKQVASILRRQCGRFGSSDASLRNIDDLELPDGFAVVTGQQVGLFGGPMYTIYKACTAIRIAAELRTADIRAVPVFWLDTDDHDLAEVTRCTIAASGRSPEQKDYRRLLFGDLPHSSRPVGPVEFPPAIRQVIEDYFSGQPATSWKETALSAVESAYFPGATFADGFGRFMSRLFSSHGLVLFDPREADAKSLVAPVFRKALVEAEAMHDALASRARTLEASGFHAQVHVLENSTALFLEENSERRALVREGADVAVKGTGIRYSLSRLLEHLSDSPARFSPNVLLRPVVQDTLLPTLCYVGGPGEIAYFAQAEALYRLYARPMPAIWPRVSLTLLDAETAGIVKQFGLAWQDCFQGQEHVLEKMLKASGSTVAESVLRGLEEELEKAFDKLRPVLVTAEGSLGPAQDTAKRKIFHHLEGLRTRFVQSEARRHSEVLLKAELLINTCQPNRNLQERELGICHFLCRSGPKVLDDIYSLMRIDSLAHHVAVLSG